MEAECSSELFWDALGLLVIAYVKVSPKKLLFRGCFGHSHFWSGVMGFPGGGCVRLVDLWKQQKIISRLTVHEMWLQFPSLVCLLLWSFWASIKLPQLSYDTVIPIRSCMTAYGPEWHLMHVAGVSAAPLCVDHSCGLGRIRIWSSGAEVE